MTPDSPQLHPETLPDPAPVLAIIDGMRQSKAIFAALELGVFDLLARQPLPLSDCAHRLALNPDAAERLLDFCVVAGMLSREHGLYANTPLAATYIVRNSPHTLAGYMLYANRITWRLWQNLEDAVREGTPRWGQTFGERDDIFDHFFQSEDSKRTFLAGMHGLGQLSSKAIAAAFDLSHHSVAADLGGGTGHLVVAICQRYPQIEGVVFDLPTVIPLTREYLDASDCGNRIRCLGGDFFRDPLPTADLYCLGRIFHDWTEAKIRALLRKMHAALPPGGGVLLAEALLSDEKTAPASGLLQSLNMLACTEGKERSLPEYRALFESEGFTSLQGARTGTVLDAIYARKASH